MNEKNYFLFNYAENPDHWKISEIILDQCNKYPKREIIEFNSIGLSDGRK